MKFINVRTCDTYGMRLLGIPLGSSPIKPEGWDPTGLKYRKVTTDHGSAVEYDGRRRKRSEGERGRDGGREKETDGERKR
jgi:hypothetical protein